MVGDWRGVSDSGRYYILSFTKVFFGAADWQFK